MDTENKTEGASTGLSRSLQPRHMFMITIGGIIGAGLFVGSSSAIATAGPAVVVSYALTGLLILLVMRMLGEMAVSMQGVRSFTEFARAGLGNWAGFSVGWLYWYFWGIVIPIEATAGAKILHDDLGFTALSQLQTGSLLMLVMTGVNLMSARSYGEFEFWFSSIKVGAILAFVAIAGAYAFGFTSSGNTFSNLTAHGGFAPFGWVAVLAAVTTVIFSMMGAEIVTIAAAESTEPAKAVARMTSSVISRIMLFYVVSLTLIVAVVPWKEIVPPESPFTHALTTMGIPAAGKVMSFVILTAVLSCLNSCFYICSRVLFVLAEKGDAPRWLVKTNAAKVPARSVLLGAAFGFAGLYAEALFADVFSFLVNATGAIILFIYVAMAIAQIRLRQRMDAAGETPVLPMWGFPHLSWFAVFAMVAVLVAMAATPSLATQFWASVVSVVVVLLAYLVRRGR